MNETELIHLFRLAAEALRQASHLAGKIIDKENSVTPSVWGTLSNRLDSAAQLLKGTEDGREGQGVEELKKNTPPAVPIALAMHIVPSETPAVSGGSGQEDPPRDEATRR